MANLSEGNNTSVRDNAFVEIVGSDGTAIGNIADSLKVTVTGVSAASGAIINRTDVASAARTSSGNSGTLETSGLACLDYLIDISAASGTNPTLQITLEISEDGTNWSTLSVSRVFTTTTTKLYTLIELPSKYYRYSWTIAGTTPSFTFSITTTIKNFLPITDTANYEGVNGNITVTNSATAARVGSNNLSRRKNLTVHNNSSNTLYWGYSNSVSTSNGTPLIKDQFLSLDIGENITVYLIAASGSNDVRVTENA